MFILLAALPHMQHFSTSAAAAAKSLQSCPTLCDPIDGSPPGSPVPGILQARALEWVAISFSNAWKWKVKSLSRVWPLVTPWTVAYQAPPSMRFSRQEYWSGLPFPSPVKHTKWPNYEYKPRFVYTKAHVISIMSQGLWIISQEVFPESLSFKRKRGVAYHSIDIISRSVKPATQS